MRSSLSLGNIFPGRIDLFERRYLAVLFYKLNQRVGKFLHAKLEPFVWDQLLVRRAGRNYVESTARSHYYLKLEPVRSFIGTGEALRNCGPDGRRSPREYGFCLVK